MHDEYARAMRAIHTDKPSLRRNFPEDVSVQAAITYNFGPHTACRCHTDKKNRGPGECEVSPWGTFDYTEGSHIICWELSLMIEFPPGCTLFLPSALISHSNTTIKKHETRYSVTRYTAAGLFRWEYNHFMSDRAAVAGSSKEELKKRKEDRDARWETSLKLFPKVVLKK
jgi:hypothetical protein